MKEKIIKLYDFEELEENAQQNACEIVSELIRDNEIKGLTEELKTHLIDTYKLEKKEFEIDYEFFEKNTFFDFEYLDVLNYDVLREKDYEKANVFELYLLEHFAEDTKMWESMIDWLSFAHVDVSKCLVVYEGVCSTEGLANKVCKALTDKVYKTICREMEEYGYQYTHNDYDMEEIEFYCELEGLTFNEKGELES